jgi:hypothetical protein
MVNALLETTMLETTVHPNGTGNIGNNSVRNNSACSDMTHIWCPHQLNCNWTLGNNTDLQLLSNKTQDIYKLKRISSWVQEFDPLSRTIE